MIKLRARKRAAAVSPLGSQYARRSRSLHCLQGPPNLKEHLCALLVRFRVSGLGLGRRVEGAQRLQPQAGLSKLASTVEKRSNVDGNDCGSDVGFALDVSRDDRCGRLRHGWLVDGSRP